MQTARGSCCLPAHCYCLLAEVHYHLALLHWLPGRHWAWLPCTHLRPDSCIILALPFSMLPTDVATVAQTNKGLSCCTMAARCVHACRAELFIWISGLQLAAFWAAMAASKQDVPHV